MGSRWSWIPRGQVAEFISYEGTVVAIDGPAAGRISESMAVAEGKRPYLSSSCSWPAFSGRCLVLTPRLIPAIRFNQVSIPPPGGATVLSLPGQVHSGLADGYVITRLWEARDARGETVPRAAVDPSRVRPQTALCLLSIRPGLACGSLTDPDDTGGIGGPGGESAAQAEPWLSVDQQTSL
ncbi:MAG: hypothetical protein U1G07_15665 [Verrucomicrobiota bacterium]